MNSRLRHCRRGSVLATTLVVAAVLFLAGLAVSFRLTNQVKLSRKAVEYDRAWQAAMAGLEECMGYVRWDPTGQSNVAHAASGTIVCQKSYSGQGVSYTVKAVAASTRQLLLSSTGTASGISRTVGAVAQVALTQGGGLQAWGGGKLQFAGGGTIEGEIYAANDVSVGGSFGVCGHIFASGTASRGNNVSDLPNCNVGFYSNYPWVQFPDFQVASLKSRATMTIVGDYTPECSPSDNARTADCDGPVSGEKIVWVKGKLSFSAYQKNGKGKLYNDGLTYTGRVIYIADGGVDVNTGITRATGAMLQVIADGTGKTINVHPGNTVEGIWVNPNGSFNTPGNVTLHGLVFANVWDNNGTLNWVADPLTGVCTGTGCVGARLAIVKLWEQ